MDLSDRYACIPNSIVLTTARVELHGKLPVLYSVTLDKKQSLIFQMMSIFFQEIQTISAVMLLFDVARQIAVSTPQFKPFMFTYNF